MFIYSVVKTQIPAPPPGGAGIFLYLSWDSNWKSKQSGGLFLPPVQKLAASSILRSKMQTNLRRVTKPLKTLRFRGFLLYPVKNKTPCLFVHFTKGRVSVFLCPENNYLDSRTIRLSQRFLNASLRRKPQKVSAIRPFRTTIRIFIPSKSTWISPPRSPHWQKRI